MLPRQLRWVNDIAFSSDDTMVATSGDDERIRVWSIPSGEELWAFRAQCMSSLFLPGNEVLLATSNTTVEFIPVKREARDADPADLLAAAEREAGLQLKDFALVLSKRGSNVTP